MNLKLGGLHEKHAVATWNLGTMEAEASVTNAQYANLVRTAKKTYQLTITNINC
jgi:hypothetical protein